MIYIGICDDELIHQSKNQACCEHFFSTNKLDHTYIFFIQLMMLSHIVLITFPYCYLI